MSDLDGVAAFLDARAACPRRGAAGHIATARPPGRPAVGLFEAQLRALVTTAGACTPTPPPGLTPRQLAILELIAHGLDTEQIAAALDKHPVTVKKDATVLLYAFRAADRAHLVAQAVLRGVLVRSRDGNRLVLAIPTPGGQ